jgi:hypothetical protein
MLEMSHNALDIFTTILQVQLDSHSHFTDEETES